MRVYRIVQNKSRSTDLSGTGAHRAGGRWNSKGTYMLYTSENRSLAYLETLVHFDQSIFPPHLFIVEIEINDAAPIVTLPDAEYPANWQEVGTVETQQLGDLKMNEKNFLGIKVRSAVIAMEYNFLLNPLYPDYVNLVKVLSATEIPTDARLKI